MLSRTNRILTMGGAASALAFIVGCSQPATPTSPSAASSGSLAVVRQAELNAFEVCKDYSGTVGPAVTINVTVDTDNNGSIDSSSSIQLSNGQCQEIWSDTGSGADLVTVTEVVPAGYTVSFVRSRLLLTTLTVDPPVQGNSASGLVALGDRGTLVVFTNTPVTSLPGTQGCTPGYWKGDQHFDSWPAPYTPNTLFSAVFENAFPGMTLLEVLQQGGGGLKALGRHTVAALLNAESGGVAYPMTTAQVISAFNAAFPGGNISGLHLQLEALNEAGCPLN